MEIVKSRNLTEPVLVGRERELEELQHCLELAIEGKGTTVFVSGEAGTGKTRLVNEFLDSVKQKKEIITLEGWCLSNAGVPYFPFIEAFNAYFSTLSDESGSARPQQRSAQAGSEEWELVEDEVVKLDSWLKRQEITESSEMLRYLSPQALKDQTFAAVTKALLRISENKPTNPVYR